MVPEQFRLDVRVHLCAQFGELVEELLGGMAVENMEEAFELVPKVVVNGAAEVTAWRLAPSPGRGAAAR